MTIKQLGGVFGRNPTFNDVTIEGQLTFDGDIDVNSDLKVDGDLEVTGVVDINGTGLRGTVGDGSFNQSAYLGFQSDRAFFGYDSSQNAIVQSTANKGIVFEVNDNTYGSGSRALHIKSDTDVEVTAGNLIIGTSGKGIDFSATAGTGTSELLDDYEEGTWTPAAWYQNGTDQAAVTNVTQTGTYTKVGNLVTVHCYLTWTISTTPVNDNIGVKNLPFTQTSQQACAAAIVGNAATNPATTWTVVGIGPSAPYVYLSDGVEGSNKADEVGGTGTKTLRFTLTYEAA